MDYTPLISVSLTEVSRHTLIDVASYSDFLQESTIRDHRTALVRPLATLQFWRGLRRRYACLSIRWMNLGDIQRGGWRFRVGGSGSWVLRVWNLESTLLSSTSGVY